MCVFFLLVINHNLILSNHRRFLRGCRATTTAAQRVSLRDLLSYSCQAADGLAHLAALGILHRNLSAEEILIDEDNICKVGGYGHAPFSVADPLLRRWLVGFFFCLA